MFDSFDQDGFDKSLGFQMVRFGCLRTLPSGQECQHKLLIEKLGNQYSTNFVVKYLFLYRKNSQIRVHMIQDVPQRILMFAFWNFGMQINLICKIFVRIKIQRINFKFM